jgi:CHAD domain-containing protein
VFGKRVEAWVDELKEVTETLGNHQDAYVAQVALREFAASTDGPTGYALGLLHGVEVEAEFADRAVFLDRAWPRATRAARRSGML